MKKSTSQINYEGGELGLFKNAKNWKKYFSKHIQPFINGDVLEVGAGIGTNTKFLSSNITGITSWELLEPDNKLVNEISANISNLELPSVSIISGVLTDVGKKCYDTIIYIDVLEHIQKSKEEILEIKKHLNPGGHLIILVPSYNFLFNEFDKKVGHFRRYSKRILINDIDNQLMVKKLFYLDSIGFFASLMNKLILKKELPSSDNIQLWDTYLIQLSKFFDVLFLKSFGKSLIGIFKYEG